MALSEWERELPDAGPDDAGPGAIGGVAFVAAMSGVAFAGMTSVGAGTLAALLAAPWLGACLGIGECQVFCVWVIGSMLPERSKDDDDFQRTAGRAAEGLQAA